MAFELLGKVYIQKTAQLFDTYLHIIHTPQTGKSRPHFVAMSWVSTFYLKPFFYRKSCSKTLAAQHLHQTFWWTCPYLKTFREIWLERQFQIDRIRSQGVVPVSFQKRAVRMFMAMKGQKSKWSELEHVLFRKQLEDKTVKEVGTYIDRKKQYRTVHQQLCVWGSGYGKK